MPAHDLARGLVAGHHENPHLLVHALRRCLADPGATVGFPGVSGRPVGERPERRHAELADHAARDLRRALDVVAGAARHLPQKQLFGNASAHQNRNLRFEEFSGVSVPIGLGQLHRHAERTSARDDGDLVQRIGVGNNAATTACPDSW